MKFRRGGKHTVESNGANRRRRKSDGGLLLKHSQKKKIGGCPNTYGLARNRQRSGKAKAKRIIDGSKQKLGEQRKSTLLGR